MVKSIKHKDVGLRSTRYFSRVFASMEGHILRPSIGLKSVILRSEYEDLKKGSGFFCCFVVLFFVLHSRSITWTPMKWRGEGVG